MGGMLRTFQLSLFVWLIAFTGIIISGDGLPHIKAYGSGCIGCFNTYEKRLKALEENGLASVEANHFSKVEGAEDELQSIRKSLRVPDEWWSKTTVVVDGRYIFEYEVALNELESFLKSDYRKLDSLVIRKGVGYFEFIIDGGEPVECADMNLTKCIETTRGLPGNTLALVLVSGLLDGINPCAFTVLVLFVSLLTSKTGRDKEPLLMGGLYIITIFLTYMAIGLSLYKLVELSQRAIWIVKVGAVVLVLMGLLNLFEFISGRGFTLRMPFSGQMEVYNWMAKLTYPGTVVAGVLVALFEFPCTGAVYFSIISLLASTETFTRGYTYLVFYNLVFIIPLVIILFLTWYGGEKIEAVGSVKHSYLKLFSSILFIFLGLYLLYQH